MLPVITYGLETMAITKKTAERLRVTQRSMERIMLSVSIRDKIRNSIIRDKTKLIDVIETITPLKWQWIGHVVRQDTERWTHRIMFWRPRGTKRSLECPQTRWTDDVKTIASRQWTRRAGNRQAWKELEEAYIQLWMNPG